MVILTTIMATNHIATHAMKSAGGIQRGDVTHNHDQSATTLIPVSFNTRNTRNNMNIGENDKILFDRLDMIICV